MSDDPFKNMKNEDFFFTRKPRREIRSISTELGSKTATIQDEVKMIDGQKYHILVYHTTIKTRHIVVERLPNDEVHDDDSTT